MSCAIVASNCHQPANLEFVAHAFAGIAMGRSFIVIQF